jgi:hypothetical protein
MQEGNDMSVVVALITGALAFVGALFGNFLAFDLNATAKRREVRREQIERFADLIGEDQTWLGDYRTELLFREGPEGTPAHFDRAYGIYALYFADELKGCDNSSYRSATCLCHRNRRGFFGAPSARAGSKGSAKAGARFGGDKKESNRTVDAVSGGEIRMLQSSEQCR